MTASATRQPRSAAETERVVGLAFADAQRSLAAHGHAVRSLSRAVTSDTAAFLKAFLHALNRALMVFDRHPAVERVVAFVATFAAAHAPFAMQILAYLSEHAGSGSRAGKAVRFRAVQVIAAVITALPEDAEIGDVLWAHLLDGAQARSRDKVARVRAAAAGALCRLQTTGDPADDPVTARLVEMLARDSIAAVRKSAINAVAVTEATLPYLIRRTRDVKDDVRKTAYWVLAHKLDPLKLDVAARLGILKSGLGDRAAMVREACVNELLLKGWLDRACEGDVFALVELLGGYEQEEVVLQALSIVFKSEKHDHLLKEIEIDINNLTFSDVLVLRAMSQIQKSDSVLDKYIPSTLAYSEMLKYYAVDGFASCHLLALCNGLDMSDEAGRRELESTIRNDFLRSQNVSDDTVPQAVRALHVVTFDADSATRTLTELVREKILRVHDVNQDVAMSDMPGSMPPDSQAEERNDEEVKAWRERRALLICKEALLCGQQARTSSVGVNSMYVDLVQHTAVPQLMNVAGENRATAFECIALFCLLDKSGSEARAKIPLFLEACRKDELVVQEVALQAIMDFLMAFDLNNSAGDIGDSSQSSIYTNNAPAVTSPDGKGPTEECTQLISQLMTHIEGSLRSTAVAGMAKLLFCRRLAGSGAMLSRMLIAYHNPSTEDDTQMRQCLSVFFQAYAHSNATNRQVLQSALLPTLRVFHDAPTSSPLCTVNSGLVGQFIFHLIGLGEKNESVVEDMHAEIAESFLNEILDVLDDGASTDAVRMYAKLLSGMRFEDGKEKNGLLIKLVDAALEAVDDKRTSTALHKFRHRIGAPLPSPR